MAHFCACVGSGVSRDLAGIIRVTFWFHLCNDRPRGNRFSSGYRSEAYHAPQISLNLLAQIIPGTLLAGNPIANMVRTGLNISFRLLLLTLHADLQGLCGADTARGDIVRPGLEIGSLHQSTPTSDVLGCDFPHFSENRAPSDSTQQYKASEQFLLRSSRLA